MRIVVVATLVTLASFAVACQRADRAERSAELVAQRAVEAPPPAPAVSLPQSTAQTPQTFGQPASCCGGGASCGGSCGGGSCGGSCGGGTGVAWPAVPAGSSWTELRVAGMKCGGCARRIERALASLDGVLAVEIDVTTASVKVATAARVDARKLAKPAIDALGYLVR